MNKLWLLLPALGLLLCGCPEHTATDLDIVPHRPAPLAQNTVASREHGRAVHRPAPRRPAPHRRAPRA